MRRHLCLTQLALGTTILISGCQEPSDAATDATSEATDSTDDDATSDSGDEPPSDPFHIPPPAECDVASQNQFVVDVMRSFYLWHDELPPDIDISAYDSPESLIVALRQGHDRWSRVSSIVTSDALYMEGMYIGTGFRTLRDDERRLWVSNVVVGSPGGNAGLVRGDEILAINGLTVAELDETDGWTEAYGENLPGVSATFEVRHSDDVVESVVVTKDWIQLITVPIAEVLDGPDGTKVGYYMLDKLVAPTKDELEVAFEQFKANGVTSLVIDARYSSGGLLAVAGRNTSLALGAAHGGEVAYQYLFNADLSDQNATTRMEARDNSLGVDRIVALTSSNTNSATELLINALRPYAEVTLIGTDTGGKPYGMKGFEFCDKRVYPIVYRLANADGDTDYVDGLPADCYATDDVFHELGDPQEGMLAAALAYLADGSCESQPMPAPGAPLSRAPRASGGGELLVPHGHEDIGYW